MKITEYDILQALSMDSIYNVLSWYDRAKARLFLLGKTKKLTPRITKLSQMVVKYNIQPPKVQYKKDKRFCFLHDGEYLPIHQYKQLNPDITILFQDFGKYLEILGNKQIK